MAALTDEQYISAALHSVGEAELEGNIPRQPYRVVAQLHAQLKQAAIDNTKLVAGCVELDKDVARYRKANTRLINEIDTLMRSLSLEKST